MRIQNNVKIISPFSSFIGAWLLVLFLYALNASDILVYDTITTIGITLLILTPFTLGYFFTSAFRSIIKKSNLIKNTYRGVLEDNKKAVAQRVSFMTYLFIIILVVEIAVEGYIPLITMLLGKSISQFDFGISSVHGFLLALGAINITASYYVYLKYKEKKFLFFVFLYFIVFALLVTRKMMVISIIQMFFVYICLRGKPPAKKIYLFAILAIIGIVTFGVVGDIRTGREAFISLAHPNFEYPDWLPSGFMWVYIYITTPLLNLTNAIYTTSTHTYDLQFACSMLPGVIRESIGCSNAGIGFDNDYQISGAFNIATGYISLFTSWGVAGIVIFSTLHGSAALAFFSRVKPTIKNILSYSVFMQTTMLLIFSNGFFNLNIVTQFLILAFCFRRCTNLKLSN